MVSIVSSPANTASSPKSAVEENLLTPRFYTTDFERAANLDLSAGEVNLKAMLAEMPTDYNRHHFVQDQAFKQTGENIQGKDRQAFVDYLERSCVSEFSGFLLFKELSRRLKGRVLCWRKFSR